MDDVNTQHQGPRKNLRKLDLPLSPQTWPVLCIPEEDFTEVEWERMLMLLALFRPCVVDVDGGGQETEAQEATGSENGDVVEVTAVDAGASPSPSAIQEVS